MLYAVLLSQQLYGLTGQGHGGVIGFFQKIVLNFGTDNLWFDRYEYLLFLLVNGP